MRALALMAAVIFAGTGGYAVASEIVPVADPNPPIPQIDASVGPDSAPTAQQKLVRLHRLYHRERRRANLLSARLAHREDYRQTLRLAALVYPRAPAALADRIMRCESGPGRGTPDPRAKNPRSSAGGRAQYLDTTWATTPEGKAGLSRFDPVAAVFSIFRHFHNGGSASPWTASAGCWS